MKQKRFEMRVEDTELAEWKKRAESQSTTLAEWIRERCNDEVQSRKSDEDTGKGRRKGGVAMRLRKEADDTAGSNEGTVTGSDEGHRRIKTCKHGAARGYHCWQCKGVAVIE